MLESLVAGCFAPTYVAQIGPTGCILNPTSKLALPIYNTTLAEEPLDVLLNDYSLKIGRYYTGTSDYFFRHYLGLLDKKRVFKFE